MRYRSRTCSPSSERASGAPEAGGAAATSRRHQPTAETRRRPAAAASALVQRPSARPRSRLLDNGYAAAADRAGREAAGPIALVDGADRRADGRALGRQLPRPRHRPAHRHACRRRHRHPRSRPRAPGRPAGPDAAWRHPDRGSGSGRSACCPTGPRSHSEDHLRRVQGAQVEFLGLRPAVRRLRHPSRHRPALPLGRRHAARRAVRGAAAASTAASSQALEVEIEALLPRGATRPVGARHAAQTRGEPVAAARSATTDGRVVDGRDGWLSTIAFHAVHDAIAAGDRLDAERLAETVWERFDGDRRPGAPGCDGGALLDRRRRAEGRRQAAAARRGPAAAARPAGGRGRLPGADALGGTRRGDELDAALAESLRADRGLACRPDGAGAAIGIKATVGLGKSAGARRHLLALRARLIAAGAPSRHRGASRRRTRLPRRRRPPGGPRASRVAVLRGYEASDPANRYADVPRPRRRSGPPSRRGSRCTRPPAPPTVAAAPSSTAA